MQLRRFNEAGINEVEYWLQAASIDPSIEPPYSLAESFIHTEAIGRKISKDIFVDDAFETKMTLAIAIGQALNQAALDEESLEKDSGFWTWLVFNFVDRFMKKNQRPGEGGLWIYTPNNWRRAYRHKMAGVWEVFRAHRDDPARLKAVLCMDIYTTGEIFEQMIASKRHMLSPGVMELVTKLYFDEVEQKQKRGSGGKAGGSPRRLSAVLDQLGQTFDIEELGWKALAEKLPSDFKKFLPK